jgi:hypothetical protein
VDSVLVTFKLPLSVAFCTGYRHKCQSHVKVQRRTREQSAWPRAHATCHMRVLIATQCQHDTSAGSSLIAMQIAGCTPIWQGQRSKRLSREPNPPRNGSHPRPPGVCAKEQSTQLLARKRLHEELRVWVAPSTIGLFEALLVRPCFEGDVRSTRCSAERYKDVLQHRLELPTCTHWTMQPGMQPLHRTPSILIVTLLLLTYRKRSLLYVSGSYFSLSILQGRVTTPSSRTVESDRDEPDAIKRAPRFG